MQGRMYLTTNGRLSRRRRCRCDGGKRLCSCFVGSCATEMPKGTTEKLNTQNTSSDVGEVKRAKWNSLGTHTFKSHIFICFPLPLLFVFLFFSISLLLLLLFLFYCIIRARATNAAAEQFLLFFHRAMEILLSVSMFLAFVGFPLAT